MLLCRSFIANLFNSEVAKKKGKTGGGSGKKGNKKRNQKMSQGSDVSDMPDAKSMEIAFKETRVALVYNLHFTVKTHFTKGIFLAVGGGSPFGFREFLLHANMEVAKSTHIMSLYV